LKKQIHRDLVCIIIWYSRDACGFEMLDQAIREPVWKLHYSLPIGVATSGGFRPVEGGIGMGSVDA
jgi:hypothetical protein